MITRVANKIYSVDHHVAEGKSAIVFGLCGAIAIDVCMLPEEGQVMFDFIRAQCCKPNRVILTHGHTDHVLGGEAFAGAEVYAHVNTFNEIRQHLRAYADKSGANYDALLEQALFPTVTFPDQLFIDLGGKHLHLFPTPGHSIDHISVYVEEDQVLIAGDTVVTGIVPAVFYDSRELENTLNNLLNLDIQTLIAGHGPVLYGKSAIHAWLRWEIGYLSSIREQIQTLLMRQPESTLNMIADQITYDAFIGNQLPKSKFGMETRHRNTVMKIIEEVLETEKIC